MSSCLNKLFSAFSTKAPSHGSDAGPRRSHACAQAPSLAARAVFYPALLLALLLLNLAPAPMQAQAEQESSPPIFSSAATEKQPLALEARLYAAPAEPPAQRARPLLVIWLTPAPDYYTYAHAPQPASKPTTLKVLADDGESPLTDAVVLYPPGQEYPDILNKSEMKFLYREPTPLFIELPAAAAGSDLEFKLSALLCSSVHCLPVTKFFKISLPKLEKDTPKAEKQSWWPDYLTLRKQEQAGTNPAPKAGLAGSVAPPGSAGSNGPGGAAASDSATTPPPATSAAPALPYATQALSAQPLNPDVAEITSWTITPRFALPALEVRSLSMALLFGLLAGFILNFMPCMLPVIGLKLTAFIASGGMRQDERAIKSFRSYWLFFSGGVICWFITLSVLVATLNLMWGQAFQSGLLVLGMILVVFSLALSTFGFYTLPIISLRGHTPFPHQAFITGFLLTCLTTPCSGPLLGGVLAWTFRQGAETSSLVLLAVGLGMVTPYLFLAAFPGLSRYCPRPGRWLLRLEIAVGFFLLLTTGYLMYMLPEAFLPWAIAMLLVLTLIAVLVHYNSKIRQHAHWKAFTLSIFYLITLVVAWRVLIQPATALESDWAEFSVAEFKEYWGRKPIIMDFTADWCANCKVLESTVLTKDRLEAWAERYGAVFIKADLTQDNPAAQAMLQALDSASIPVVALFPAGGNADSPLVLRDLFTTQQIETAINKTFR